MRRIRAASLLVWVRIGLGLVWGGLLVLIALACFDRPPAWIRSEVAQAAGLCCFAAGQFVLMTMVLDAACPRAAEAVTWTLKLTAGLVFWGAGGCACILWARRDGPPPACCEATADGSGANETRLNEMP